MKSLYFMLLACPAHQQCLFDSFLPCCNFSVLFSLLRFIITLPLIFIDDGLQPSPKFSSLACRFSFPPPFFLQCQSIANPPSSGNSCPSRAAQSVLLLLLMMHLCLPPFLPSLYSKFVQHPGFFFPFNKCVF